MRHRLTASKLALAALCIYWAREDVIPDRPGDGKGSRIGCGFHEAASLHPTVDLDAIAAKWRLTDSEADSYLECFDSWLGWFRGYVGGRAMHREKPFAWDTSTWTARQLPQGEHRDYTACLPTEVPCTVDLVLLGDAGLEVLDYKTSWDHISAEGHAQLAGCGLAVARALGYEQVKTTIARVRPEGVEVNSVVLQADQLDRAAYRLEMFLHEIPTARPKPGEHCAGCPSAGNCPETRAMVVQAREERPELSGLFLGELRTQEQAKRLRAGLKPLEAFLSEQEHRLIAFARKHDGIELGNGKRARRAPETRRRLNPEPAVIERLVRRFGPEKAGELIRTKTTVSIGAVEKMAGEHAPQGVTKKAAAAEVMAELESTGHVALSTYEGWRVS